MTMCRMKTTHHVYLEYKILSAVAGGLSVTAVGVEASTKNRSLAEAFADGDRNALEEAVKYGATGPTDLEIKAVELPGYTPGLNGAYNSYSPEFPVMRAESLAAYRDWKAQSLLPLVSLPLVSEDPFAETERAAPPDGPVALLSLELIGDDADARLREAEQAVTLAAGRAAGRLFAPDAENGVWVKQLLGIGDAGKFHKRFVRGQKDYSRANSVGSRGVLLHFFLPPGVYQVQEKIAWRNVRPYFVESAAGLIKEISRMEAVTWLKNRG